MIRSVRIRGFKLFQDAEFHLAGHAVLIGPNDAGKTTLLQAIASWALAFCRWRDLGDYGRSNGRLCKRLRRAGFPRTRGENRPRRGDRRAEMMVEAGSVS